jgi:hypothetical protein
LEFERFTSANGQVKSLRWAYPAETDQGLEWRNDIRLGLFEDRSSVEHLISIDSSEYRVAPAQFALGSPSVIRNLCTDATVKIGDMRIKATPYQVESGNVGDFIALLTSGARRLPVVFVSPYADGSANRVDALALARSLAGVGIVVSAQDVDATWDIADELGRTLSCFDGGARIYWPGFQAGNDPRMHRLFLGSRIEAMGAQVTAKAIERSIFAVAAFRFVPDAQIERVVREAQQAERLQRVEEQKASAGDSWEAVALELDADLAKANQAIADLAAENRNLKENQQVFLSTQIGGEGGDDDPNVADIPSPSTVKEAVAQAKKILPNLIILDSAFDSAAQSPFKRPDDILSALRDLDAIAEASAKQRIESGSGGDLLQHLKNRGWGKRSSMHISNTTRATHKSRYEFEYAGKRQLFEPHITLGSGDPNSCASIHFVVDAARERIVVAHVGRHLPNTRT